MPRYLFQGGADSQGQLGPTKQKVQDRYNFQQEKAKALEPVMDVAMPFAAYSGDAQGAINPVDPRLMMRIRELLGKGATERQIYEDLNAIRSGKNVWGTHEKDMPKDLSHLFRQNKHGYQEYIGPDTMRLDQVLGGKSIARGDSPVNFRRDMPANVRAEIVAGSGGVPHGMNVNVGRLQKNVDDYVGPITHENNHLWDNELNLANPDLPTRSVGVNASRLDPAYVKDLQTMLNQRYDVYDHYLHNAGEVRGRQNEMLNMQPEKYEGISSMFSDERPLREQMLWGR